MAAASALLIEDNPADRALIGHEIRADVDLPFKLETADSLRTGLQILNSKRIDVVLLDLSLPDAHGLDAVQTLTETWPDLAVVVLTGFDNAQTALEALKQGAQDYLSKNSLDGTVLIRSLQYAIERKRIAVELRRSEQRYRALVAAMTSIVWSTDANGKIQSEQPFWSEYTGQAWGKYAEYGWLDALHAEDRAIIEAFWRSGADPGTEVEFLTRVWHDKSRRHRRCVARVVPIIAVGTSVTEWVGTLTDVEDAQQAEEALRRAERLASLGTLAAGIAHEINNPIVAAWTSAEAALNVLGQPASQDLLAECLQNVIQSVVRCRDTVEGVLRFARHGTVEQHNCDIARVIRQAINEVEHYATERLQSLTWTSTANLPVIYGNEAQMQQVLVTLMRNAIEAGNAGQLVELKAIGFDDSVEITVTDSGHGMTATEQQRAFDPFFTSRKERGTGLGLSIAHGIMEGHGGSITLASDEGRGTTVTLRFPASATSAGTKDTTSRDSTV